MKLFLKELSYNQICPSKKDAFTNKSLQQVIDFKDFWFDSLKLNPDDYFERFNTFYFGDCFHFNSGRNMKGESVPLLNSSSVDSGIYAKFWNVSILIFINEPSSVPVFNGFMYKNNFLFYSK